MRKWLGLCSVVWGLTACGARGTDPGESQPTPAASTVVIVTPDMCSADADCGEDAVCIDGSCLLADDPVVNVPPTGEGSDEGGGADEPDPPQPTQDAAMAAKVDGVWEGYVEAYSFRSGSDAVRVEIHSDGCTPSATITLGEGEPLPPAEDPDTGYPTSEQFGFGVVSWYEGQPYQAHSIEISKKRVQIGIESADVWADWCEMQTSYAMDDSGENFMCVPNYGSRSSSDGCALFGPDGEIPIDCGKLELCQFGPCDCDEAGCQQGNVGGSMLDVALDDGHLEGTFQGFGAVRLYRVR